ncbi:hypothetical protein Tco_1512600, partial [Tanacetum coccineum]
TNSYAIDDDKLLTKKLSQKLMEEMSQTVDEAKLRKVVNEMLRQRCTSGDEHCMGKQKRNLSLTISTKA